MAFLAPAIPHIAGAVAGVAASAVAKHNAPKPGSASAPGSPVNQDQINNSIYRTQVGLDQQQDLVRALQGQSAIANQSSVFGQQQDLANQLQQQALGQGPNPALAQLANTTGQNIAQQGALMAGQRGAGTNAGLLARQIAQQGAGVQQQAAGQAAALGAQQQLSAQQALQQQQALMANLTGQQVGQFQNANQQYNAATQNFQNSLMNAHAGAASNMTSAALQNSKNESAMNLANYETQKQLLGGALNAIGGAFTPSDKQPPATYTPPTEEEITGGLSGVLGKARGGEIPHPSGCNSQAGRFLHEMKAGGKVPGQAAVAGDNSANDTVPTMLSPGEIVIPRSIAQHPDAPAKAAEFVAAIMRKKGK